jgi:hypothetical protein
MYVRFGLMIATSTVVMFALTYTNAFSADHVRFSEERLYMALLMGAARDCPNNGVSGSTRRPAGWRGRVADDRDIGGYEPIEY